MCWDVGTPESDERLGGVEEMYVHTGYTILHDFFKCFLSLGFQTFCEEVMPKTYLKHRASGGIGRTRVCYLSM